MLELVKETNGDALVEAAILFPIMIMIFAALVLLAIYLPIRATLQRATQYAATVIATEKSDTWLFYDKDSMTLDWEKDKSNLDNVYVALFSSVTDVAEKGEQIVIGVEGRNVSPKMGVLKVDSYVNNMLLYKEIVVTATREITVPIGLSLIKFPKDITITVTSTAVVQNSDEFVRNMDIAVDFVEYIIKEFNLTDVTDSISSFGKRVSTLFGWE